MWRLWKRFFVRVIAPAIFAVACVAGVGSSLACADESSATRPHVVIILADDLGIGDCGCYNDQSKIATPHIDRIAAQGIRFRDAHAPASWCTPTRYGLLTGRYPFRTDLRGQPVIAADRLTLPKMLRQQGYRTVMVGKWHLGFEPLSDRSAEHLGGPLDRGFDTYFGIPSSLDIPPYYFLEGRRAVRPPTDRVAASSSEGWSPIQGAFWREGGAAAGFRHADVLPDLTQRVESEIADHARQNVDTGNVQPLFLYFPMPAPHTPWLPTQTFAGRSDVPLYGDFVTQVDDCIGRVLQALEQADMADDTLLIVSSDNGPVWYATDVEKHDHDATGRYRGMKGDAWEGGHRMPLLVRWPRQIAGNQICDQLVCLTDVFATIAAIQQVDLPKDAAEDSVDMSPLLFAESRPARGTRQTLLVNSTRDFLHARRGPWKLLPFAGSGGFIQRPASPTDEQTAGDVQLYNLYDDPVEQHNVAEQHPEIVRELTQLLEERPRARQ